MTLTEDIISRTVTFVLAGGRGERLSPLTEHRSKPAVPFGNRRIIDFTLQNCLQSNLNHPLVITQYQAAHLARHVRRWWRERSVSGGDRPPLETAAPVCVPAPERAYLGTADALYRNLSALTPGIEHILILSADHIYDMDYRRLLQSHIERDADATMSVIVYPSELSRQFGILEVNQDNRICGFEEKPARPRELSGQPGRVLANMGVYVFRKDVFVDALHQDATDSTSAHDIGRNILPRLVTEKIAYAYRFDDYWRDVGTLDSYYDATLDWHEPSASGCFISEGVRIHHTAEVTDSILLPGVTVGAHARIHRSIVDQDVQVLTGATIGYGEDENFVVSANGVVVVPADSIVNPRVRLAGSLSARLTAAKV